MRPAIGAGKAAFEDAAKVRLGDSAPIVGHVEHHALAGAAGTLDACREAQSRLSPVVLGHGAVAHGVVDELPQDEDHPLGVTEDPEVLLVFKATQVNGHARLDERACAGLHGLAHQVRQLAATQEVVLGHRGAARVVEGVLHVRLHAGNLAREGPSVLAAAVCQREVHRGKRGLDLVDPKLDVAAIVLHLLLELGPSAARGLGHALQRIPGKLALGVIGLRQGVGGIEHVLLALGQPRKSPHERTLAQPLPHNAHQFKHSNEKHHELSGARLHANHRQHDGEQGNHCHGAD